MKTPNKRQLQLLVNSKGLSNIYGGQAITPAGMFPTANSIAKSNMSGVSNATGGVNPQVTNNAGIKPIKLSIRNTYSKLLYYPMFNGAGIYTVPYDGATDPINGFTPSAGTGLIATFQTGDLNLLSATIKSNPFYVQHFLYTTGTVANQLEDTFYIQQNTIDGQSNRAVFFPGDQQNLLQQVQNKVDVKGFDTFIDVTQTVFVPVEPGNTINITWYLSSQLTPSLMMEAKLPVQTWAVPGNLTSTN